MCRLLQENPDIAKLIIATLQKGAVKVYAQISLQIS